MLGCVSSGLNDLNGFDDFNVFIGFYHFQTYQRARGVRNKGGEK